MPSLGSHAYTQLLRTSLYRHSNCCKLNFRFIALLNLNVTQETAYGIAICGRTRGGMSDHMHMASHGA